MTRVPSPATSTPSKTRNARDPSVSSARGARIETVWPSFDSCDSNTTSFSRNTRPPFSSKRTASVAVTR